LRAIRPGGQFLTGEKLMKIAITAVAAGMLALAAVAAPTVAADCRGCVAAGVVPLPAYAVPARVACAGHWVRRPLVDRFGNFIGYSQPECYVR
jgi:hypothetical protein